MYVLIVGGGKVGLNLTRELVAKGHEVTLIEGDRSLYLRIEQELEHAVQYGDGTELWVLERAGIQRADLVVAVTGDDEDNILICQVAKEKYLCDRIIARCNNPRNLQHFKLLGIVPGGQRDGPDPQPHRARGARPRPRPPARPAGRAARDHRGRGGRRARPPRAAGLRPRAARRVAGDLRAPARRRRVRPEGRHGHQRRRRGPRSCSTRGSRRTSPPSSRPTARSERQTPVRAAPRRAATAR